MPYVPGKGAGPAEKALATRRKSEVVVDEKRHFDPSKEPRLLGLL